MSYAAQTPISSQPSLKANMAAGPGGNRNAMNMAPINEQGQRDWSNNFWSCAEALPTCLFGHFCPCILYSKNKTRMQHLAETGAPHPEGGEAVGIDCAIYCGLTVCTGFAWILQGFNRTQTRERYNIAPGSIGDWFATNVDPRASIAGDMLASCFCHSCQLTQQSREIELEEQSLMAQNSSQPQY